MKLEARYFVSLDGTVWSRARPTDRTALRRAVERRDRHRCRFCGSDIGMGFYDPQTGRYGGTSNEATFDHLLPLCRGGQNDITNVVQCCAHCNSRKGSRLPVEANMALLPPPDVAYLA